MRVHLTHVHDVLVHAGFSALALSVLASLAGGAALVAATSDNEVSVQQTEQTTTQLQVEGMGQIAPNSGLDTLQGAQGVDQSSTSSGGLQSPGAGNSLQPNTGQSQINRGN